MVCPVRVLPVKVIMSTSWLAASSCPAPGHCQHRVGGAGRQADGIKDFKQRHRTAG
jgi:hypothetical protein